MAAAMASMSCAVARVGWGTYAKWQIKMQGFFFVIGSIFMILAVAINFS